METPDASRARSLVASSSHRYPGLRLLVLHGSRARGDTHAGSDWDFAYFADSEFDARLLYADLAAGLGTDRLDLADLASSGGLVRYRVARDGVALLELEKGLFDRFWFDAVSFWCDAEPVLRAGYEQILQELGP